MARLTIDTGGPARLEVRDSAGRLHRPPGAVTDRTASDAPGVVAMGTPADGSGAAPFYSGHFVTEGRAELEVEPGSYLVVAEKGTEFERLEVTVDVAEARHLALAPQRWVDMAARGWWSADFHIHRPVEDAPLLLRSEDLNYGVFLTMWSDEPGVAPSGSAAPLLQVDATHVAGILNAEDERGGGAWMLHGLRRPPPFSGAAWWYPPGRSLVVAAQADGAWFDCEKLLWWEVPVMMATTEVDSVGVLNNHFVQYGMMANEAWGRPLDRDEFPGRTGFADYLLGLYSRYLNCSLRLPASAGSASGVLPAPPGYNRVYVDLGEHFSVPALYQGLRAGRSFVTNGPMLSFTADGRAPGDTLVLEGGRPVRLRASADSRVGIDRIEIVGNGHILAEGSGELLEAELPLDGYSWLIARCFERGGVTERLAHSSPIYLEGPRQRYDAHADLAYFAHWIDDLIAVTEQDAARFRTEEQRAEVLHLYRTARDFYWPA